MIRLHDTQAGQKREFLPADPTRITMYVCGPTVYGLAHIGNARPAVVFDTLARLIRHKYGEDSLIYARNVTDVDDKIIAAAIREGVGYRVITERYYSTYMDDMAALGVRPPTFAPRATAFVPQMIDLINRLIRSNHAYVAEGHVLFDVSSDLSYGSLSKREPSAIEAGARIEVAPYKRNPTDFVLWKPSGNSEQQVALSFDSPWGRGRPGWHIECSAMIEAFGSRADAGGVETIDIHGGGIDLIFPHHENESAQSRCAHDDAPLARYWVHNGFVDMGAEKMSKSLGNVVTPRELLDQGHRGEVLRLALLSAQYRQPLPWTSELLKQARARLDRWYQAKRILLKKRTVMPDKRFVEYLSDDLNTPAAMSVIDELASHALRYRDAAEKTLDKADKTTLLRRAAKCARVMVACGQLIGLLQETSLAWRTGRAVRLRGETKTFEITASKVKFRIAQRNAAKAARDFTLADRIRDALKAEGVLLEDGPGGTTWRRA